MPLVTVPGAASTTIELQFQTPENTFRTEALLAQVYAAYSAGKLAVANAPTAPPANPKLLNEYTLGDQGGVKGAGPTQGTVPTGYLAIVDGQLSSVPVEIVGAGQPNQTVVATGSLRFFTGTGSGTIVSAQGNNVIAAPTTGGGDWNLYFDTGNNTVYAASGNFLVQTDTDVTFGRNLVYLGTGNDTVVSWGQDTIVAAPSGQNLVGLFHGGSVLYGNAGASTVVNSGSNDTVVQGGGPETVYAASASGLYFGSQGALTFLAGPSTAPTVVAGAGDAILYGGPSGGGTYFVGSGAFLLDGGSGNSTVVGLRGVASGAVLFAENGGAMNLVGDSNGNLLVAGAGSATLNGGGAFGNNWYYAGTGNDRIAAGAGADTIVAGPGTDTLVGGAGLTVFDINAAVAAGGQELISKWTNSDQLWLIGYGAATGASGLPAGATLSDMQGSAVLSLPDGTRITFQNVASVGPVAGPSRLTGRERPGAGAPRGRRSAVGQPPVTCLPSRSA